MSNSVLSGLRQFAVIDPATDTAVVLTRLTSDSTYEPANIQTESTDGAVYGGRDYNIDIGFYDADSAKLAQLKTWMENDTPVQCVALGIKAVLHWFEPTTISTNSMLNPNARDGASSSRIVLTTQNPLSDIKQGINFLKAAIWRDSFGSYTPPRTIVSAGDPPSASVYGQAIEVTAQTVTVEFPFPFEGATVFGGMDADAAITATIIAKNAAGSTLSSQALSGAGREVGSLTLPANTYSVAFQFVSATADEAANITARIDGITTYTPN